jgi:hypothetical protein
MVRENIRQNLGANLQARDNGAQIGDMSRPLGAGLCVLQCLGGAFGLGLCRNGPALGFCGVLTRPV